MSLLNLFKLEYLLDIYIGVTGIIVAIVIFIAQVIKDQNDELSKKVILYRTKIGDRIKIILSIFLYLLIIKLFKNDVSNNIYENIVFYITHFVSLLFVIMSICLTCRVFIIALKLNTEKDYFNKELEKYIYKKVLILEKKDNNKKKFKNNKKEFKNFLKDDNIYFTDETYIKDKLEYEPIYPIKAGIIEKYDYKKLNELRDFYNSKSLSNENFDIKDNNVVFIRNCIGKKVSKKEPIFYCLKQYKDIFDKLNSMVIYKDNRIFINDEIKNINNCLFDLAAEYKEPDFFDENNRLYNYFKYLYDNKLFEIKTFALASVEEYFRKVYNDYPKNRQFTRFLDMLSSLVYSYDDYEEYEKINNIELHLYINQLNEKNVDKKAVAYNFANNMFRFNLYSVKKNVDERYYDNLMSVLLKFIVYLIKTSNYDAINVLLDNILMERINYRDNELDKYDVVNFQFACGIIYCLIMMENHEMLRDENLKTIRRLINYINNFLIGIYDAWDVIFYFKELFNKKSNIQKYYSNFDFEFIDHEYKNNWSVICIDTIIVLKEFLFIYNIDFVNINSIDKEKIILKDKYFYKNLLELINKTEQSKLDSLLNIHYNKKNIIEALNIAVKDVENKEKEYNRINKLDDEKVNNFKEIIKNNIQKDNKLVDDLIKYDKLKNSEYKAKKAFGINQLIPRDVFFNEVGGYEQIANSYADALKIGIEKEYIKKLERNSIIKNDSLENFMSNIENIEDYVVIANFINRSILKKFDYDYKDNFFVYNDKKISVIIIPQIDEIYLLKKEDLPIIEFCGFTEEWNKNNIDDSLYYEFEDCSKNEELRKKIIDSSEWLKEKGTEKEQDDYLKECCRIRIYLAYSIKLNKNVSVYRFENDF